MFAGYDFHMKSVKKVDEKERGTNCDIVMIL